MVFFAEALSNKPTKTVCLACAKRGKTRDFRLHWNLDITKGQGTGDFCSLLGGFVISRFFSLYFTIAGIKKIVCYAEDVVIWRFVKSRFHCTSD